MNRSGYGGHGCLVDAGTAGRKEENGGRFWGQCTISKKASAYRLKRLSRNPLGARECWRNYPTGTLAEFCTPAGYGDVRSHFGLILGSDHVRQQVSGTVSRSAPAPPPAVPYRRASRPRRAGSIGSADRSAAQAADFLVAPAVAADDPAGQYAVYHFQLGGDQVHAELLGERPE